MIRNVYIRMFDWHLHTVARQLPLSHVYVKLLGDIAFVRLCRKGEDKDRLLASTTAWNVARSFSLETAQPCDFLGQTTQPECQACRIEWWLMNK